MRNRIKVKVNVQDAIEQIECEVKAYSRAIKAVMLLHEVAYNDAKWILERRLTNKLLFKN